jgi:hypothetical protein
MANKIETSYSGMFLDTRLKTILDDLNKQLINLQLSTKEDISSLFNKVIRDYHKSLSKSLFTYKPVASGNDPDAIKINTDYAIIFNDLKILYSSMKNTRDLLTSNYNTLSGMSLKIKTDIAEVSSKLIDYKIQNTNKFSPTFIDSFYNLSKIETDDSKYSKEKTFVDTYNNNVVLPLDKEATIGKIKKASIVEDSVGVSGNNQEINGILRDNLKLALDNSVDTWFEFEQVGSTELQAATVLNLKLELEEEIFFNLMDINTIQMPNGSYPAILDIRGSTDGSIFFDLKPLYLGVKAFDSIGNEVIPLGEKTDNPNGGNLLYFSPRKVKYISVKFIEDSSFYIRTSSGLKYRRAIGIRELKVKSQKFKNEGQFISSNLLTNKEISKITLFTEEYLPPNFKTTFNYFMSVDNGLNWEPISPSQKVKDKIPEVLNYNVDYLIDSKKTDFPIMSVKIKSEVLLEEGDETTSVTSSYTTKNQTEFMNLGSGIKSINLQRVPFGNVHLYKTNYGSVGKDSYLKMSNTAMKEMQDRYILQLPLDVFPSGAIQIDQEVLFIDNYSWTRTNDLLDVSDATTLSYEFDYTNNIITFAKDDDGDQKGKKPSGDIYFKLKRENVSLEPRTNGTAIKTNLPHDAIKENINFYSIEETVTAVAFKLKNLASLHRLNIEEIDSITVDTDINNILSTEKDFINGVVELSDAGDYSIDKKRGVIYTYVALNSTDEVKITASYRKKNNVIFDVVDSELITTQELKKDNKNFNIDVITAAYAVDLGFRNIQERSLIFTELPDLLETEVLFKNIDIEFNEANTSGKYCIDYKNGVLYVQNKVDGKIVGTLVNSNYFAEYNISYKVPESSYTLLVNERRIDLSDRFVSDFFNSSSNDILSPSLMKVEYSYTEEVKESLSELFPYTTPFLMEYKIITTPKEAL